MSGVRMGKDVLATAEWDCIFRRMKLWPLCLCVRFRATPKSLLHLWWQRNKTNLQSQVAAHEWWPTKWMNLLLSESVSLKSKFNSAAESIVSLCSVSSAYTLNVCSFRREIIINYCGSQRTPLFVLFYRYSTFANGIRMKWNAASEFIWYEIGIDSATYFISVLLNTQHHFSWTLVHPSRNSFLFFFFASGAAKENVQWANAFCNVERQWHAPVNVTLPTTKERSWNEWRKLSFHFFSWIHFLCFSFERRHRRQWRHADRSYRMRK